MVRTHTHTNTHRQDRLQYTAPQLARSVTIAFQSLKLPVDSICDPPLDISFYWFRDYASVHWAVGPPMLLVRRSRTHWQMNCELTRVTDLRQPEKRIQRITGFAVMRYINLRLKRVDVFYVHNAMYYRYLRPTFT